MARPGERQLLTAEQERIARAALARGLGTTEAAALAGVTRRRLQLRLEDQLSDCRIGRGRRPPGRRAECDPTEAEIEARKREIRAIKGDLPSGDTSPATADPGGFGNG